jgi:hypothetical protein
MSNYFQAFFFIFFAKRAIWARYPHLLEVGLRTTDTKNGRKSETPKLFEFQRFNIFMSRIISGNKHLINNVDWARPDPPLTAQNYCKMLFTLENFT